jgi:hypothetical protein
MDGIKTAPLGRRQPAQALLEHHRPEQNNIPAICTLKRMARGMARSGRSDSAPRVAALSKPMKLSIATNHP